MPTQPEPGAKERLLAAVLDHVVERGLGDLSLRELAAAVGTSHRMLLYHFGSKEGLVVEIVRAVEADQQRVLDELAADPDLSPADVARAMWHRFADPAMAGRERLFFEIYAAALQGRPGTEALFDHDIAGWVDRVAAAPRQPGRHTRGRPIARAQADSRLGVAVMRGLLLDLLATGDRAAVDAAFDRYLALTR